MTIGNHGQNLIDFLRLHCPHLAPPKRLREDEEGSEANNQLSRADDFL